MSERRRPYTFEQTHRRPRSRELLPKVNPTRKAVANHEIRHAAVVKKLGHKAELTTVKPTSLYDGAMTPGGILPVAHMQITAMASAGHGGTGSDEYKAHRLQFSEQGISVGSAKGIAQNILASYTDEILDTAATYLAYDGTATDSQITQYFIWAREDLQEEKEQGVNPESLDPNKADFTEDETDSSVTDESHYEDNEDKTHAPTQAGTIIELNQKNIAPLYREISSYYDQDGIPLFERRRPLKKAA